MPDIEALRFATFLAMFLIFGTKGLLLIIDPKGTACVSRFDKVFTYTSAVGSVVAMAVMLSQQQ